jgi:hypothetical protein
MCDISVQVTPLKVIPINGRAKSECVAASAIKTMFEKTKKKKFIQMFRLVCRL